MKFCFIIRVFVLLGVFFNANSKNTPPQGSAGEINGKIKGIKRFEANIMLKYLVINAVL